MDDESDEEVSWPKLSRRRKAGSRVSKSNRAPSADQEQALRSQVYETVAGIIGQELGMDVPLMDAGLDSLGAVELRNSLAQVVGLDVPGTLVFDYPSVSALAGYLGSQVQGDEEEVESVSGYTSSSTQDSETPAVMIYSARCDASVGVMGVQLDSTPPTEGLGTVPFTRWDLEAPNDSSTMRTRFAGFMKDVDLWDIKFFGVSHSEGMQTDSQQRMLMTSVYTVLTRAGETMTGVRGSDRSVVVGISAIEYVHMLERSGVASTAYTSLGGSLSVACGRLSYTFGFNGPSYSVDTACSASLVSTHIASSTLQNAESERSVASGVQHTVTPMPFIVLVISNMLSSDGRCKTLDQTADGYVRGETCGVFALKTDHEDDAHAMLVVLCASSVNQDGRSSSLTAPNGPSQQSVIQGSLRRWVLTLAQYEQHEMHGTGTPLGDPIEVGAICAVLMRPKVERGPLKLSAAKVAHGHAEAGAGVIGSMHALNNITHVYTPLITNLRIVNPYVADTTNIMKLTVAPRIGTALVVTHAEHTSTHGVSAFAYQGTNAHAILGATHHSLVAGTQSTITWETAFVWPLPHVHAMVGSALALKQKVTMHTRIGGPLLGYLWDHRVNDRALLPGTGCMEMATAAGYTILSEASNHEHLAVSGISFRLPQELCDVHLHTVSDNRAKGGTAIECVMDLRKSHFQLNSVEQNNVQIYAS